MMDLGTHITAVIAAVVVAAGGLVGATSSDGSGSSRETAIVIDAAAARDGRDLVDPRLEDADAEVRLPRTAAEARTDMLYMAELGKRVVVAGRQATAAADGTDVAAVKARGLTGALAAAER
jgi:glucose/arabinose dehydrogenase